MSAQPITLTGRQLITFWIEENDFIERDTYQDAHHFGEMVDSAPQIGREDIHYGPELAGQLLLDRYNTHMQTTRSLALERYSRLYAEYDTFVYNFAAEWAEMVRAADGDDMARSMSTYELMERREDLKLDSERELLQLVANGESESRNLRNHSMDPDEEPEVEVAQRHRNLYDLRALRLDP